MRHFRSSDNFRQYQPTQNRWAVWKKKRSKRHLLARPTPLSPNNSKINNKSPIPWYIAIFLGLIVVWLILVIYLPFFRVTRVVYNGLKIIKQSEFENAISTNFFKYHWFWPKNNYFFLKENKIKEFLRDKFSLRTINVKKIFPNTLNIELEESISAIIYDNGSGYFLLDQTGTAIKYLGDTKDASQFFTTASSSALSLESTKISVFASSSLLSNFIFNNTKKQHVPEYRILTKEYGTYPIVYDLRHPSTTEKQTNILKPDFISAIINSKEQIQKQGIAIVYYFVVENSMEGVMAVTNQPWKIFLQPLDDITTQLVNIRLILKNNQPKQYIDVRFDERIYWK